VNRCFKADTSSEPFLFLPFRGAQEGRSTLGGAQNTDPVASVRPRLIGLHSHVCDSPLPSAAACS
jgi:hypothetical protein